MKLLPMKMHPFYTEYLWGGSLLKEKYNKADAPEVTAESWELSANSYGMSTVNEGPYKGKTLVQLYEVDNTIFGSGVKNGFLPLLIKLIDANQNLSIQVHPSDSNAIKENAENGKEEIWYIIDCKNDSYIYYGFSKDTSAEEVRMRIQDGTICSILNKVNVKKGQLFLIKPGTLHAIGSGNLIAEIQQNSNTTFRVFDYDRTGSDGKKRELHIERALEVMNFKKTPIDSNSLKNSNSEYFKLNIMDISSETNLFCSDKSFQHLLCTEGELNILFENGKYQMKTGESYFIPAGLGAYQISGKGKLIVSLLP